ncbi:MAG: alpha/beta hydrolase, partial [Candidatus Limnocylindria bacterium]
LGLAWPPRGARRAYAARLAVFAAMVATLAYLGISLKYAEGLTRVARQPLVPAATYVAPSHEDVAFVTRDGLTLRGWWFASPAPRGRAAVLVHGKDVNRIMTSFDSGRIARFLLANGYSVLLFDLRGHGTSDGLRWGLGQHEAVDILAAIDLAAGKANVDRKRVAVIGESMGGGSVLMAVKADPGIGPVVVDSAYASAPAVVDEVGPQYSGLPSFFTPGLLLMSRLFFGIDIAQVVPADVVRAHPDRAFLFVHCADDRTVAAHHGRALRAASANPASELWMVPGCGHVKAFVTRPAEWEQRVLAFLERELR